MSILSKSRPPDLDPIVITSPVIRSGTTLLQRLLCSSPEALIYGELCGQDLEFFLQLYLVKTQIYTQKKPFFADNLRKVLEGDVNNWMPDLMPDMDAYLTALGQGAFAGLASCRDHAAGVGRRVWGFKYPGWRPAMIQLLRRTMPQSRFICILRNLRDCARSAKAQGELQTEEQLRVFCKEWAENSRFFQEVADDPAFLVVRYEDLAGQPDEVLRRLAEFTGLTTINRDVLTHKINTGGGGYKAPAELSEEEMRIVTEMGPN